MNVGDVLLDVLVVLIAAKVAAEVAERLGLPAVVGEIVAGILIGPSVLGLVGSDEVLRVLGEIGVILLLLEVGLQMDLAELGAVGRASTLVAVVGVVVPFALGWAVAGALGQEGNAALFVGAALTATSVGITARVFGDLRALATTEARIVLGAAVVDDVIGLVILTIVVKITTGGSVSLAGVAGVVALAVGFLVVTGVAGVKLAPPLFQRVHWLARSPGTLVALALAFTLAFSELAQVAGLAAIVGAFMAGLALSHSSQAERIRRELTPVGHLFIPVFFLQIGIDADIRQFAEPAVLALAAGLLIVAVAGKLVSALGAFGTPGDRGLIGLGMLPRGEVGLIFAGLGLREGILGQDLYAALLLVILVTTLVTPPLLRWRLQKVRGARRLKPATKAPEGGWLKVGDGSVELAGIPGGHLALHIALEASLLATTARPGPVLLDWLGSQGNAPLRWDKPATALLFRVLQEGNPRTWRFLEISGVLDRALPELADTFRRRRADMFELDPTHPLRWSLVDGARQQLDRAAVSLAHPEWLLLAALILESADEGESPVEAARRLVKRLDLGAAAEQEIALLVGDSGLLLAAAARPEGLREEAILPLAMHLDRLERARALYVLSLALEELDPAHRRRLDEINVLVEAALAHTELTGRESRNLVERRRAEATRIAGPESRGARRVANAPVRYLMAQASADIARAAALIDPVPPLGRVRVAVTPTAGGSTSRVEVVSRDQEGLMALVTGALTVAGLDVVEATVATWPDGAAMESFLVSGTAPEPAALEEAVGAAFGRAQATGPVADAAVTFDDDGSPWYTLCEVAAADRPGLLHAVAVAFTAAGADVHAASVTTVGGQARDRFELTDRTGAKLDATIEAGIRQALVHGVSLARRRRRAPHKVAMNPKHSGDKAETPVP